MFKYHTRDVGIIKKKVFSFLLARERKLGSTIQSFPQGGWL